MSRGFRSGVGQSKVLSAGSRLLMGAGRKIEASIMGDNDIWVVGADVENWMGAAQSMANVFRGAS